jgi:hypothetical protein
MSSGASTPARTDRGSATPGEAALSATPTTSLPPLKDIACVGSAGLICKSKVIGSVASVGRF